MTNLENSDVDSTEFVRLLTEHQRLLYSYIHSLLPNRQDVEDVLQETNYVIWRESKRFELGTNFRAWSCTVALNQVRAFVTKRARKHQPVFDDSVIVAIAERQSRHSNYYDARIEVLKKCIMKLSDKKRMFVNQRYGSDMSVEDVAVQAGLSPAGVYKLLGRIRTILHTCVNRELSSDQG